MGSWIKKTDAFGPSGDTEIAESAQTQLNEAQKKTIEEIDQMVNSIDGSELSEEHRDNAECSDLEYDLDDNDTESMNSTKVSDNQIKSVLSYDKTFKRVFSLKSILAGILAECIPEYKGLTPDRIKDLIESEPGNDRHAKLLNDTSYNDKGNEFIFDLLFNCIIPGSSKKRTMQLYIDMEMQRIWRGSKDYKRAIHYAAGRLFNQKLSKADAYNELIPVYSIWITQHVPEKIAKYFRYVKLQEVTAKNNVYTEWNKETKKDAEGFENALQMLNIIYNFVPVSREEAERHGGPLAFIWDIFHLQLNSEQVNKYIPEDDKETIKEGVIKMSEYEKVAQKIERGLRDAESAGKAEGREEGIKLTISTGKKYGASKESMISDLMNNLKITSDVAKSYVDRYWDLT